MKKQIFNGSVYKHFSNFLNDRALIRELFSKIPGIYMFTNLLNNKKYLGSSGNLYQRFNFYYSPSSLEAFKNKMLICKALKKYGPENFSVSIIETCPDGKEALCREQFFLDNYFFEYNISPKASRGPGRKKGSGNRYKGKAVIAINMLTGEKLEFKSILLCSEYFYLNTQQLSQAIKNGYRVQMYWRVYFK